MEVDEGQHFNRDGFPTTHHIAREADIVNATNHVVKRINVAKVCIDKINEEIATIVNQIKADFKKKAPTAWDIDAEFNPDTYIQKRKILVEDNVVLKKHVDVCKCFGLNYKRHQRGDAKHLKEKDTIIWFPKLYDNGVWKNSISDDEKLISEELVSSNKKWNNNLEHLKYALKHNNQNRIVFAHSKNNLGETLYRFKGVFKLNIEKSNSKQKCIYDRIAVEIDLSNFSQ